MFMLVGVLVKFFDSLIFFKDLSLSLKDSLLFTLVVETQIDQISLQPVYNSIDLTMIQVHKWSCQGF